MKNLVSVIIPTFNRYEFLQDAIESVKSQTYKNIEIIIVNDGSTDQNYYEKNFQKSFKFVNLAENQKIKYGFGPGNIRNHGIKLAKGKYIAFLDDDDIWLETKLEEQLNLMLDKNIHFACSDSYYGLGRFDKNMNYEIYNKEKFFKKIKKKLKNNNIKIKNNFPQIWDYKMISIHNSIITSSVIVKKNYLEMIGGFRPLPFAEDYDCWLGILRFTDLVYVDKPLLYYDGNHGYGKNY